MALDRYTKLELTVRTAYRQHLVDKLTSGKNRPLVVPGFEIPRGGSVDLILPHKGNTIIGLVQRSDYVAAYKHTIGAVIGTLVHYHAMTDRELREALRTAQARPEIEELKQTAIDPLRVSKRLAEDRAVGAITVALVTELPEVPQQARELEANFFPISALLQAWLPTPVKKKKLCSDLELYGVNPNATPPTVLPLDEALKPLLKLAP